LFEAIGKLGGQGTGNSKARKQKVGTADLKVARRVVEELWVREVFAKTFLC
jgi:hypothetical protein